MALDQNIKDLQAQNAQFQQMTVALAKGQEDLKDLIMKDKKKKPKKPTLKPVYVMICMICICNAFKELIGFKLF